MYQTLITAADAPPISEVVVAKNRHRLTVFLRPSVVVGVVYLQLLIFIWLTRGYSAIDGLLYSITTHNKYILWLSQWYTITFLIFEAGTFLHVKSFLL
jgi:hypothetical protein